MSHYEDYCKTACRWCAEGIPVELTFPRARVHWVNHEDVKCTALDPDAWGEQQFERAERNWKAGAEAMRKAILTDLESYRAVKADDQGVFRRVAEFVQVLVKPMIERLSALPIPEEPK